MGYAFQSETYQQNPNEVDLRSCMSHVLVNYWSYSMRVCTMSSIAPEYSNQRYQAYNLVYHYVYLISWICMNNCSFLFCTYIIIVIQICNEIVILFLMRIKSVTLNIWFRLMPVSCSPQKISVKYFRVFFFIYIL